VHWALRLAVLIAPRLRSSLTDWQFIQFKGWK